MSSSKGITLGELAKRLNAKLKGDPKKLVEGVNTLSSACSSDISFLSRKKFLKELKITKACAVLIEEEDQEFAPCDTIVGKDAYLLYAKATQIFKEINEDHILNGISDLADISPSAKISSSATIGPFSQISDNVEIGEKVSIGSGVVVGKSSKIGNETLIYSNVSIYHSVFIGSKSIIHSGTVIGSDGLGFVREGKNWVKIEHLGKVIIGNNVEIGSNCSIDRGSIGDTSLEDQVKLDNQVHLAHNVCIGQASVIAANTTVAGSTTIGKNCTISGGCGIIDNLEIADSVHITALSLVTKSIDKPGTYTSGTTLMEHNLWKKNAVLFKKLKDIIKN